DQQRQDGQRLAAALADFQILPELIQSCGAVIRWQLVECGGSLLALWLNRRGGLEASFRRQLGAAGRTLALAEFQQELAASWTMESCHRDFSISLVRSSDRLGIVTE